MGLIYKGHPNPTLHCAARRYDLQYIKCRLGVFTFPLQPSLHFSATQLSRSSQQPNTLLLRVGEEIIWLCLDEVSMAEKTNQDANLHRSYQISSPCTQPLGWGGRVDYCISAQIKLAPLFPSLDKGIHHTCQGAGIHSPQQVRKPLM